MTTNERRQAPIGASDLELDRALRESVGAPNAKAALVRIVRAFDVRGRRRDAVAIAETARAASLAASLKGGR